MSVTFIRARRRGDLAPMRECRRFHHPDFNARATQGWKSLDAEGRLPADGWRREQKWALDMGLPGADSLTDRSIPTFSRGELPHFAGINTFLKAPYVENVRDVARYDAAVVGIPFDSGTTYRPGTRFGQQGIRRISALYTPYNYELGVDLREQMTLCDAGDVFTIPANLEKSFDQITRGVAHVASSGALPIMLGGDHSIGFPCVRGIAQCTSKRIGIIHFDRHIDIQEKDLDERMHTTPWYWATNGPHDHSHDHPHPHARSHDHPHPHARPGHNGARDAAQWQTPHLPAGHVHDPITPHERDLDLVEASFVEGFTRCSDASRPGPSPAGAPVHPSRPVHPECPERRAEQGRCGALSGYEPTGGGHRRGAAGSGGGFGRSDAAGAAPRVRRGARAGCLVTRGLQSLADAGAAFVRLAVLREPAASEGKQVRS